MRSYAEVKTDSTVLDYSNLVGVTLFALYDSSSWESFAELLADIESAEASSVTLGARLRRSMSDRAYIARRGFPRTRTSSRASRP